MVVPLEELRAAFRVTHTKKIIKGLLQLGVPYKLVDGKPLVLRAAMERAMSGAPDTVTAQPIDMAARLARAKEKGSGTKAAARHRTA